jgi:hypothetical protein
MVIELSRVPEYREHQNISLPAFQIPSGGSITPLKASQIFHHRESIKQNILLSIDVFTGNSITSLKLSQSNHH